MNATTVLQLNKESQVYQTLSSFKVRFSILKRTLLANAAPISFPVIEHKGLDYNGTELN